MNRQYEENQLKQDEEQLAIIVGNRILGIQKVDEGYDYSIYDEQFQLLDGGVYDDSEISIREALHEIVDDLKETKYDAVRDIYYRASYQGDINETSVPYEIATWVYGRSVNLDYHVVFEYNRYSCPYQYAKKKVDLRVTDTTVEIYSGSNRLTTHNRFAAGRKNQYSTHEEDMPDKFKFSPWNEERIQNWADSIGEYTGKAVSRIFSSVRIKEQGFNPALAVLRLSNKYSSERLEAACEYAITHGMSKPRYHHLNSILAANQDITYLESKNTENKKSGSMGYLRGSDYYGGGTNDQ